MEIIEKLRAWSFKQQCLDKSAAEPLQVLNDLCGVYSWHPSTALSLRARLKNFTAADFSNLNTSRDVLRIPCMRLSVHLVPAAYASRLMAATVPQDPAYWEKRYSQDGRKIPQASYEAIKKSVLNVSREALEPAEIAAASGVDEAIIKFVLNRLAFEGHIVRVGSDNLRANKLKYISAKAAYGKSLHGDDQLKSLVWLADKYFHAFGPARIKDFQWWAGTTVAKAREAVLSHQTEIIPEGKEDFYIPAKLSKDFNAFNEDVKDSFSVLPQWDAYTMGYAPDGRQRFVDAEFQPQIYGAIGATGGNGLGTLLSGGKAIASWDQKLSGNKLTVNVSPFKKLSSTIKARIEKEFSEISELYRTKKMELHLS